MAIDMNTKVPDHSLVNCTVNLSCYAGFNDHIDQQDVNQTPGNGRCQQHPVHRRYRTSVISSDIFENARCRRCLGDIVNQLETTVTNQDGIDNEYEKLIELIHEEMDRNLDYKDYTPGMKKRKKRSKPYWDDEVAKLWKNARDDERTYLSCNGSTTVKRTLRLKFVHSRDRFDKALRRAQRQYNARQQNYISALRTDNPREFWREIDKLSPDARVTPPPPPPPPPSGVMRDDGSIATDPDEVLNRWKQDFQRLYDTDDTTVQNTEFMTGLEQLSRQWEAEYDDILRRGAENDDNENDQDDVRHIQQASEMLNRPITLQETVNTLRCSRNGKAVGVDNVANEILKIPALQSSLHALYSRCFELCTVPRTWYKAIIHPILKAGKSPLLPLNYRGISLMSTVCKVFSAILNNRIVLYAEINGIYVDEQNGFRRLRSCLDHLYVLNTILRNRKQQGLHTYCCFVDFAKAFDSVNHTMLWHKLLAYGVHGSMINTIKSLYSNLQSCVRVNGQLTDWFSQSTGVRQGDTLAPTLFALFINDLAMDINSLSKGVLVNGKNVSILMYADDVVLISDSADGLQTMLNSLDSWSSDWMLDINHDKTKAMHFRPTNCPGTDHPFVIGSNDIDITDYYRYLGYEFSYNLDHNHGVKILNKAAGKALGSVTAKFFALDGTSYDVYKNMYESLVCPVMDYANEIWGSNHIVALTLHSTERCGHS